MPKSIGFSLLIAGMVVAVAAASWAAAPQGRYVIGADTVVDTKTKLTWQRAAASRAYDWASAKSYCQSLGLGGMAGWRLPALKELRSIVDLRAANPSIDATAFPGTSSAKFWTSLPRANNTTEAWVVDFAGGNALLLSVAGALSVRCVR